MDIFWDDFYKHPSIILHALYLNGVVGQHTQGDVEEISNHEVGCEELQIRNNDTPKHRDANSLAPVQVLSYNT